MFCFSIVDLNSFEYLDEVIHQFHRIKELQYGEACGVIVGCKSDLADLNHNHTHGDIEKGNGKRQLRQVTKEMVVAKYGNTGFPYIETSALKSSNVRESFDLCAAQYESCMKARAMTPSEPRKKKQNKNSASQCAIL